MVLGARELLCAAGILPAGQTLTITVKLLMQDERFGSLSAASTTARRRAALTPSSRLRKNLPTLFQQGAS